MSILLSGINIAGVEFKNRIVISPMCQYSSIDGFANDWHLVHLGSRATGGAGLIIQEATAVSPEGRISYGDLGIWKDDHVEKLKHIVGFIHEHGAKVGIQLAHAGRKASCEVPWKGGGQIKDDASKSWQTVSASAIPFKDTENAPTELDKEGITSIINDFKAAAQRSIEAGYDVIEVHAAHGYLLHQFYSPFSNKRTDEYGGSFENRIRLTLEIVSAVKQVWGSRPLFVRISSTDWTEGGWTIEDSIELAGRLEVAGVHVIDASTGGNVPAAKIPVGPGYQVQFADQIRKKTGMITGAVGLITSPGQAEEILQKGEADLIFIARESLRDPNFAITAAYELGDDIAWLPQYERAKLRKH